MGCALSAGWVALLAAAAPGPALVDATTRLPDLVLDLRYATADNFLHQQVYPDHARCLVRAELAQRLVQAAAALKPKGYRLKVYDCYRPHSVQEQMWKLFPKPGYVADPKLGSHHNRGAAVDLTLVTLAGEPVEMPTPFDTFSRAAHHRYEGGTAPSRAHRDLLRHAMEAAGLQRNPMEWWHYDLPEAAQFPLLDEPLVTPK